MKVIFLNTFPLYNKDIKIYYPDTDAFYLFGMGAFIAKEFIKRGFDITFESWRMDLRISQMMEKNIDGIFCRIFPSQKNRLLKEYSKSIVDAIRLESQNSGVIFHFMGAHNLNYHYYSFFMRNNRVVCTHLGGANPFWKYQQSKKILSLLYYWLEKLILLKNYDRFITMCMSEACYFTKVKKQVSLMPIFGLSNEHLFKIKDRRQCREKLGLPLDKIIVLQVGRAEKNRGFDWILDIIDNNLLSKNYFLKFVGVDRDDEYYHCLISRGFDVVGYSSHEVLQEYYNAADVLMYLPHEPLDLNFAGTSFVPLEAMVCGTPVVATTFLHFPSDEVGEVSRIPKNRDDVIPMINELLALNVSRAKCREIVLRAFSWNAVTKRHWELYNQ